MQSYQKGDLFLYTNENSNLGDGGVVGFSLQNLLHLAVLWCKWRKFLTFYPPLPFPLFSTERNETLLYELFWNNISDWLVTIFIHFSTEHVGDGEGGT